MAGNAVDPLTAGLIGIAGSVLGYLVRELFAVITVGSARERAAELLDQAKREAEERAMAARAQLDAELEQRRAALEKQLRTESEAIAVVQQEVDRNEREIAARVAALEQQERYVDELQQRVDTTEQLLDRRERQLEKQLAREARELQRIGRMTAEQARSELLERIGNEIEGELACRVASEIARAENEADERARQLILLAIQRQATARTAEHVVATVDVPSDEMKGRIIGREGRNIRTFEQLTGTDLIIDDTPGVVVVSCFDSLRREVARRALDKLVIDGRIHPARIEEIVAATRAELDEIIEEVGHQVCYDTNIHGVHARLVMALGRLRFHHGSGSSVLDHSVQVAQLCGVLAAELRLDTQRARRAGLLHDIGKALDHRTEGSHAAAGADLARRCDEPEEVVNAIAAHHAEQTPSSVYAVLVQIANTLAHQRPQRIDDLTGFIQRMEKLEALATSFEGILYAHAIRAGREVRVVVDSRAVDDAHALLLCRQITRRIAQELTYPNELRVTLLREHRSVEYSQG